MDQSVFIVLPAKASLKPKLIITIYEADICVSAFVDGSECFYRAAS
jgi:hypothetical protein